MSKVIPDSLIKTEEDRMKLFFLFSFLGIMIAVIVIMLRPIQ